MNTKALSFATQIMVMAILISVVLLFVGIGILVLIHVCIVGRSFRRDFRSITRPQDDRRRGLSLDELKKLPCYEFKIEEKMSDTTDCAVCLESFQVGERCRLLPACRHSFHAQCVDSWLLKSSICPICRRSADGLKDGKAGSDDQVEMREVREGQVVVVGVSLSGDHPIPHASSSR
ncbi:hypothetical protein Cni_G20890 [Canna indica]|uniref:RING-type domain-containing protein n=1 Tax=Canna indica TaxID=4628 RepID=A0AAQ3KPX9_9LILI|nr:hypothetical protein Cni_G20890 [Canna indica]